MNLLQLKNVSLKFENKQILNNISIDFWKGYIHAVVGPNGAGKSTLAYTIMGLDDYREFSGEILYNDKNINKLSIDQRGKQGITLGWQEPARFEGLSVIDFISCSAKDKSLKNIRDVLEKSGLSPDLYIDRKVDKTLSGGERKKVELASILAMEPQLLVLDEPDSGIDIQSLENIFQIIHFLKEKGATVILVTHSPAVLKQADHAFLMCHGEIIDKGEINKIIPYFEGKCLPCPHKNIPESGEIKS